MDEKNKHLTPVWIVYVDGRRLDAEHEGALNRIEITERLNSISTFSLFFNTADVNILDKETFSMESQISIHLGYKDDVDEVFAGDVLGFKAVFPEYGAEELEITGCNVLHRLTHGSHNRGFEEQSPSSVIKGLIEACSLQADVEEFGAIREFAAVEGQTDYEFIMNTAAEYGKDVFASGNTVFVGNEISVRTDEIIFEWGKSLLRFEVARNIRSLVSSFDFLGWDHIKEEAFVGHADLSEIPVKVGGSNGWTDFSKSGKNTFTGTRMGFFQKDADDAKQSAIGFLQRNSFLFGRAKGTAEGNYKLRPGMRVTIKGIKEAFDGEYIAEEVNHQFGGLTGFVTNFTLKRNMFP
jgi:phage protein D